MSDHDPIDTALQPESTEAQAKAARAARQEIEDLQWLMAQKRGRRIVWRLLQHAGVYRLSYREGDAYATTFLEGQRNQGLSLLAQLMEHCASDYGLMVTERTNARS